MTDVYFIPTPSHEATKQQLDFAAKEIKRLRSALQKISRLTRNNELGTGLWWANKIASDALENKHD